MDQTSDTQQLVFCRFRSSHRNVPQAVANFGIGTLVSRFHETCVGRVRFNPPSRVEWRVKANPPYAGRYDSNIGNAVLVSAIAFAFILVQAPSVLAAGRDEAVADPEIAGPARVEPGAWRSKVQQKFDPQTRTLSRQLYTIWD